MKDNIANAFNKGHKGLVIYVTAGHPTMTESEKLIGEIIGLLQSPIRRVISALENKGEGAPEAKAEAPAEQAAPQEEAPAAE